jgi:hypothetical protein
MNMAVELFALLAAVVLVLYGMSVGRTRALVSLLSIYAAYVLTVLFPFLAKASTWLPERVQPYALVIVFLVSYALVFVILSSSVRRGRLTLGEMGLWQVLVISVVQVGLLAVICVSLVPAETSQGLLGALYRWMSGPYALWGWAAVSLAILPFLRVRRRD